MLESCQQKNPASGCPLDPPSLPFSSGRYSALSLLPAKGATAVLSAQGNMYRSFQSTHPRGVRLKLSTNPVTARTVSIHAPARGATATVTTEPETLSSFNPRTREGCDLVILCLPMAAPCFNPRTREGCDFQVCIKIFIIESFNPRTREGCDCAFAKPVEQGL